MDNDLEVTYKIRVEVFGRKNQIIQTKLPVFTTESRGNACDYIDGLKMLATATQERFIYKISVERVYDINDLYDSIETNNALTDTNNLIGWNLTPHKGALA